MQRRRDVTMHREPLFGALEQEISSFNTVPLKTEKGFTGEEERRRGKKKRRKLRKRKGKKIKSRAENSCFLCFFLSRMDGANSLVSVGGDGWGADKARGMEWVYESALAAYRGRNSDVSP